jgi:Flp pilus assembly protein TadG
MKRMYTLAFSYLRHTTGAIALLFALMAPVVIGSVGMALDMAQAYLVQQRLSQALDAAALAAAASSGDEDVITQKVKDFFDVNYPEERLGLTFVPEVVVDGDEVTVTGHAQYNTWFLKLLGIETVDLFAKSIVQREVQGLEVALVLDNTGSMDSEDEDNNPSTTNITEADNIYALKVAATNFINIMFSNTSNPNFVRIGMVPYSNTVNVGRYGLGQNPDGSAYGDAFVTLPSGISYTTNRSSSSGWYGCVVEHKATNYNAAATHVSGSSGQLWRTGSGSGCNSATNCRGHGWAPNSTTNDPYDYDVLDTYEGPWDIYMFGKIISNNQQCTGTGYSSSRCSNCTGSSSRCASTYCYCGYSTPNTGCPYASVVPISSDQEFLLEQVEPDDDNLMRPDGNTLGNIGLAWGGRLISPEPPFEEGNPWDSDYWKKAVVLMTDGDNTENGTYSSYWFTSKSGMTEAKLDTRLAETCEALKEKGVLIYTVVFSDNGAVSLATQNLYQACATTEDQYLLATDQEALIDAFEQIARELSNLHIKG